MRNSGSGGSWSRPEEAAPGGGTDASWKGQQDSWQASNSHANSGQAAGRWSREGQAGHSQGGDPRPSSAGRGDSWNSSWSAGYKDAGWGRESQSWEKGDSSEKSKWSAEPSTGFSEDMPNTSSDNVFEQVDRQWGSAPSMPGKSTGRVGTGEGVGNAGKGGTVGRDRGKGERGGNGDEGMQEDEAELDQWGLKPGPQRSKGEKGSQFGKDSGKGDWDGTGDGQVSGMGDIDMQANNNIGESMESGLEHNVFEEVDRQWESAPSNPGKSTNRFGIGEGVGNAGKGGNVGYDRGKGEWSGNRDEGIQEDETELDQWGLKPGPQRSKGEKGSQFGKDSRKGDRDGMDGGQIDGMGDVEMQASDTIGESIDSGLDEYGLKPGPTRGKGAKGGLVGRHGGKGDWSGMGDVDMQSSSDVGENTDLGLDAWGLKLGPAQKGSKGGKAGGQSDLSGGKAFGRAIALGGKASLSGGKAFTDQTGPDQTGGTADFSQGKAFTDQTGGKADLSGGKAFGKAAALGGKAGLSDDSAFGKAALGGKLGKGQGKENKGAGGKGDMAPAAPWRTTTVEHEDGLPLPPSKRPRLGGTAPVSDATIRIKSVPKDWAPADVHRLCKTFGAISSVVRVGQGSFDITYKEPAVAARAFQSISSMPEVHVEHITRQQPKKQPLTQPDREPNVLVHVDELQLLGGEPLDSDCEVFVRNLPVSDYSEPQLHEWLKNFGVVADAVFLKKANNDLSGRGYVRFANHSGAVSLLETLSPDDSGSSLQGSWSLSERIFQDAGRQLFGDMSRKLASRLSSITAETGCSFISCPDLGEVGRQRHRAHFALWLDDASPGVGTQVQSALAGLLNAALTGEPEPETSEAPDEQESAVEYTTTSTWQPQQEDPPPAKRWKGGKAQEAGKGQESGKGKQSGKGQVTGKGQARTEWGAKPRQDGSGRIIEEEEDLSKPCIFVQGFPDSWTEEEIKIVFTSFGGLDSVRILEDPLGRAARVELTNPSKMTLAVNCINNREVGDGEIVEKCTLTCELFGVDGTEGLLMSDGVATRYIFLDEIKMPMRPTVMPLPQDCEVFLDYVPEDLCTIDALFEYAETFGTVLDVFILREEQLGTMSGKCYVRFVDHQHAKAFVQAHRSQAVNDHGLLATWSESERALASQRGPTSYGQKRNLLESFVDLESYAILPEILEKGNVSELVMLSEESDPPGEHGKQLHFLAKCDASEFKEVCNALDLALKAAHQIVRKGKGMSLATAPKIGPPQYILDMMARKGAKGAGKALPGAKGSPLNAAAAISAKGKAAAGKGGKAMQETQQQQEEEQEQQQRPSTMQQNKGSLGKGSLGKGAASVVADRTTNKIKDLMQQPIPFSNWGDDGAEGGGLMNDAHEIMQATANAPLQPIDLGNLELNNRLDEYEGIMLEAETLASHGQHQESYEEYCRALEFCFALLDEVADEDPAKEMLRARIDVYLAKAEEVKGCLDNPEQAASPKGKAAGKHAAGGKTKTVHSKTTGAPPSLPSKSAAAGKGKGKEAAKGTVSSSPSPSAVASGKGKFGKQVPLAGKAMGKVAAKASWEHVSAGEDADDAEEQWAEDEYSAEAEVQLGKGHHWQQQQARPLQVARAFAGKAAAGKTAAGKAASKGFGKASYGKTAGKAAAYAEEEELAEEGYAEGGGEEQQHGEHGGDETDNLSALLARQVGDAVGDEEGEGEEYDASAMDAGAPEFKSNTYNNSSSRGASAKGPLGKAFGKGGIDASSFGGSGPRPPTKGALPRLVASRPSSAFAGKGGPVGSSPVPVMTRTPKATAPWAGDGSPVRYGIPLAQGKSAAKGSKGLPPAAKGLNKGRY